MKKILILCIAINILFSSVLIEAEPFVTNSYISEYQCNLKLNARFKKQEECISFYQNKRAEKYYQQFLDIEASEVLKINIIPSPQFELEPKLFEKIKNTARKIFNTRSKKIEIIRDSAFPDMAFRSNLERYSDSSKIYYGLIEFTIMGLTQKYAIAVNESQIESFFINSIDSLLNDFETFFYDVLEYGKAKK